MRDRLAYTLSFWLLGAVVSSVLAVGGLTARNLRQGFSAYLEARDLERFDKFVLLAGQRLGEAGSAQDGEPRRPDMRTLLHAVQDATAGIAKGELGVRVPIVRGDEIGDVVRNVNAMAASLQRIDGARRRWLADLSHELRTPLTVLRGEIEALVDGVWPVSAAAMSSLRDEVLRLGQLVDDLHLLAMADLQALPCHPADADAVDIVSTALRRRGG